ncbi:MAG: hypothetical protein AAGC45_08005 [Bacteroidota bacterium]
MTPRTVLLCLLVIPSIGLAQTEFELKPSQSMLMTGKGPGQDGTINPYAGEDCYAIVENLGSSELSVRIQKQGELISTFRLLGGNTFKFKLRKDQELYLDGNDTASSMAKVSYEKLEPK